MKTDKSLNHSARTAIVSSFVNALSANESTGSLLTQVCDTARKHLKGAEISTEDQDSITKDIAAAKGWKGDSARSRMSECRVVLKSYTQLGEAISTYTAKAKTCQWHDGMKLARRINKGDSVSQAVKFALEKKDASKVSASGRTAGALKAWYKTAKADKQAAILKAADLLGIKLGIKVEA